MRKLKRLRGGNSETRGSRKLPVAATEEAQPEVHYVLQSPASQRKNPRTKHVSTTTSQVLADLVEAQSREDDEAREGASTVFTTSMTEVDEDDTVGSVTYFDDQETILSSDPIPATPPPKGFLGRATVCLTGVGDEIKGAYQDTVVSFDQVMHAFTITDEDLYAVSKRIQKARSQLKR